MARRRKNRSELPELLAGLGEIDPGSLARLTTHQRAVLAIAEWRDAPATAGELAANAGLTAGASGRALRKLQDKGLARHRGKRGRRHLWQVTEKGRQWLVADQHRQQVEAAQAFVPGAPAAGLDWARDQEDETLWRIDAIDRGTGEQVAVLRLDLAGDPRFPGQPMAAVRSAWVRPDQGPEVRRKLMELAALEADRLGDGLALASAADRTWQASRWWGRQRSAGHARQVRGKPKGSRYLMDYPAPELVNPARRPTVAKTFDYGSTPHSLTGKQLASLMRKHGATVKKLAQALQVTQKRVREVRSRGVSGQGRVYDWLVGIQRAGGSGEILASGGPSLNQALKAFGYSTKPSRFPGRKDVLDPQGRPVLQGVTADEVWQWLRGSQAANPHPVFAPALYEGLAGGLGMIGAQSLFASRKNPLGQQSNPLLAAIGNPSLPKGGSFWARRASDSKTLKVSRQVAAELVKRPGGTPPSDWLALWWVRPDWTKAKEGRWRVDAGYADLLWEWGSGTQVAHVRRSNPLLAAIGNPASRGTKRRPFLVVNTATEETISSHSSFERANQAMLAMPPGPWGVADDRTTWRTGGRPYMPWEAAQVARFKKNPPRKRKRSKKPKVSKCSLAAARSKPGFKAAMKKHQQFHGVGPAKVVKILIDDGKPGLTEKVMVSLGEVPETHYQVPGQRSSKKNTHWVHKHPAGSMPLEFYDPRAKTTTKVLRGRTNVGKWWTQ